MSLGLFEIYCDTAVAVRLPADVQLLDRFKSGSLAMRQIEALEVLA